MKILTGIRLQPQRLRKYKPTQIVMECFVFYFLNSLVREVCGDFNNCFQLQLCFQCALDSVTHQAYAYILLLVVFHTLKRTVSECFEHAWAVMPIITDKQNISLIGLGLLAELMLFSRVFAAAERLLCCI